MTGHRPVQERGQQRRATLLAAAAALLAEGGFAAVSHRAVAERADLPLAATTYYFRSRDELVTGAFDRIMRDELARLRALLGRRASGSGRDATIRTLVDALLPDDPTERRHQLTLYELYVQAGRRGTGPLRELARAWNDGCVSMTAELLADRGHALDDRDVRLLVSLSDGLMLELLVEDREDAQERAVTVLTRALTALDGRIPED